jgi:DMSO/TMAO reductase YedYZ molybdopterin-dependent catalytic subunit
LTPADLDETNLAGAAAAADGSVAGGGVGSRPVLLAYMLDGAPLARGQGLVRLIVPSETDDALRQVKWLATITIV